MKTKFESPEFTALRHARTGNEVAWTVTGRSLFRGQIVHVHAMCGAETAIKKAIEQDKAEFAQSQAAFVNRSE